MTVSVKKGNIIFRENQEGRELYYIQSGRIRIVQNKRGKQTELAILEKGSLFGEMALVDGKPRSATAIAIDDSELVVVSLSEFKKQLKGVPQWYMALIRVASEYLRDINEKLVGEQRLQTIANVSQLLVLISKQNSHKGKEKEDATAHLDLRQVKKELVDVLGLNVEPMNQAMDFLQKNNMVNLISNSIEVRDTDKLNHFSTFIRATKDRPTVEAMDGDLLEKCTRLKHLLDKTFSKQDTATFSFVNFTTEMVKNAGFDQDTLEGFLKVIQKMKIVHFVLDKGTLGNDLETIKKNGQLRFDSKYLGQVLREEDFKRINLN